MVRSYHHGTALGILCSLLTRVWRYLLIVPVVDHQLPVMLPGMLDVAHPPLQILECAGVTTRLDRGSSVGHRFLYEIDDLGLGFGGFRRCATTPAQRCALRRSDGRYTSLQASPRPSPPACCQCRSNPQGSPRTA